MIALDLEWNQPMGQGVPLWKGSPYFLMGEVIQIGLVRADPAGNPLETLRIPVRPRVYTKMHPKVRELTGITDETLKKGIPFRNAMNQMLRFFGNERVYLTWGSEDAHILRRNLLFEMLVLPALRPLDIQPMFGRKFGAARTEGLTRAVKIAGFETELDAHDALNDAIYTARIAGKLDIESVVHGFEHEKKPFHRRPKPGMTGVEGFWEDPAEALMNFHGEALCPICREKVFSDGAWAKLSGHTFMRKTRCLKHGAFYQLLCVNRCGSRWWGAETCLERETAELAEKYTRKLEDIGAE